MHLALLWLAACALDPDSRAAADYVTRLQPVLFENAELADEVLSLSSQVYEKKIPSDKLEQSWDADIVPLAEHLHDQASFVEPPPGWGESHAQLVAIWGDRASAYRSLGRAIHDGDTERWRQARELADGVKLREEEWFRTTNQRLVSYRLVVDPFP
jgi:hypothetical protein